MNWCEFLKVPFRKGETWMLGSVFWVGVGWDGVG